jgi:Fe-S-cluster-containing hydrogenase component 2
MLDVDGVPTLEDIGKNMPRRERLEQGFVAVHECFQDIPCNPCVEACPVGAVSMKTLTSTPVIDFDKCTGCGNCVASCPGLAIFLLSLNDNHAQITIPYEMPDVPQKGDKVQGLDRYGQFVCDADVIRVVRLPSLDKSSKTTLITLEIPASELMTVRSFRRR